MLPEGHTGCPRSIQAARGILIQAARGACRLSGGTHDARGAYRLPEGHTGCQRGIQAARGILIQATRGACRLPEAFTGCQRGIQSTIK